MPLKRAARICRTCSRPVSSSINEASSIGMESPGKIAGKTTLARSTTKGVRVGTPPGVTTGSVGPPRRGWRASPLRTSSNRSPAKRSIAPRRRYNVSASAGRTVPTSKPAMPRVNQNRTSPLLPARRSSGAVSSTCIRRADASRSSASKSSSDPNRSSNDRPRPAQAAGRAAEVYPYRPGSSHPLQHRLAQTSSPEESARWPYASTTPPPRCRCRATPGAPMSAHGQQWQA